MRTRPLVLPNFHSCFLRFCWWFISWRLVCICPVFNTWKRKGTSSETNYALHLSVRFVSVVTNSGLLTGGSGAGPHNSIKATQSRTISENPWNKKFLSLLTLLQMLGLEKMKHFCHRSAGSTIEIFLTLGRVLKQRVVEALRKSKAFGLLVMTRRKRV